MEKNRICQLFGIETPIIQGGMVWCSGWRLASAISNAGGLGLLGAGSMHPETLIEHIRKMNQATDKPWGINIPLMYPEIGRLMDIIVDEGVKVVFTSAGSPKKYTQMLHDAGIKVAHVVSSSKFARKCEEAGVDAVVAEGFEAGGHNGREETTTMALIPQVRQATTLPLIAAGGIGSGQAMVAAEALGAEGVQIGTLFALAKESSAADEFKRLCTSIEEGDTMLCLKKISPTRLVKNALYNRLAEAEARGADADELREMLGKAASKRGIFEGDTEDGEIEIGQIASAVKTIDDVATIMARLKAEYIETKNRLAQ
ncbi:nitronate monooxygenase [Prevotella sp. P5-92]|uniref:NAD(P)H-dependent flavin oxidoreductase n=1 Tax=Prevotella sp. P5-92 TaxID=2024222 RepID=UPI000B970B91|nr:nitronate monooxygenase [Prevotella sp. P5-92]OYP59615.1 nitronate monooxygenase [Prevotella sp. P5-92]